MHKKSMKDEGGQGLIEYVLIIALVALVVLVALSLFGLKVSNLYNETVNGVTAPMS